MLTDLTDMYFQSDLDIFQFDFMIMKPRDMPPMFCFNVETDTESLYYNSSCIQKVGVVKSLVSGAVVIQIFHANIRKGSYLLARIGQNCANDSGFLSK